MTLIAKKVTSNRGDCRLAVDICRQAVEDRLETLKSWSVNNIEPVDLDQHRCITVKEVMPLCNNRELDPELGKSRQASSELFLKRRSHPPPYHTTYRSSR